MPKLSDEVWNQRRRQVLECAFRCFARGGFRSTTIDDVIAESGLSSSVVYRYVRSKDELITAAIDECLKELSATVDTLMTADPVPGPAEVGRVFAASFDDELNERHYPLASLVIQIWAEALRVPDLADRARTIWTSERNKLQELARQWKQDGLVPSDAQPADTASMLTLLICGLVIDVTHLGGDSVDGALRHLRTLEI